MHITNAIFFVRAGGLIITTSALLSQLDFQSLILSCQEHLVGLKAVLSDHLKFEKFPIYERPASPTHEALAPIPAISFPPLLS
jgi:hypothetical protein